MKHRRLVVGAVILDDPVRPRSFLAARRIGSMAGYWEFPGGKREDGETPEQALHRELFEELCVEVELHSQVLPAAGGRWPISQRLEMELWTAHITGGELTVGEAHDEVVWTNMRSMTGLRWLPADIAVLDCLRPLFAVPSDGHLDEYQ